MNLRKPMMTTTKTSCNFVYHLYACVLCMLCVSSTNSRPNILLILCDDLGWNDVTFHGQTSYIASPNIQQLASQGVILSRYYSQSMSTASRSALLTGIYPMRLGLQHKDLAPNDPYGLALEYRLLSEELKESSAAYNTYMFGKWHLGYFHEAYTPTARGFDTFYGFYNGQQSFYNHSLSVAYDGTTYTRFDLFDGTSPVFDTLSRHAYSTDLYTAKTIAALNQLANANQNQNSDASPPFFMYLALQNVHSPLEVPAPYNDSVSPQITDTNRRKKVAKILMVDDAVGQIVAVLKDRNLWNNTVLIFSTDNGAPDNDGGSNYPLRGTKGTLYEGGVRSSAFISGGFMNISTRQSIIDAPLHITDWYPTLCDLAGIAAVDANKLDGKSFFNLIRNGSNAETAARDKILLNVDATDCDNQYGVCGGVIHYPWKLVIGPQSKRLTAPWSPDANLCISGWCSGTTEPYADILVSNMVDCNVNSSIMDDRLSWDLSTIQNQCAFNGEPCLFNLEEDPCEFIDVAAAADNSDMVTFLVQQLTFYQSQSAPELSVLNPPIDPLQMISDLFWMPWSNSSGMVREPLVTATTTTTILPTTIVPSLMARSNVTTSTTTARPSYAPTVIFTSSSQPTVALPTSAPTVAPTFTPTNTPSFSPTSAPSHSPTHTLPPTAAPTVSPTRQPHMMAVQPIGKKSYMISFYLVAIFTILGCTCMAGGLHYRKRQRSKQRHLRLEDTLKGIELKKVMPNPRVGGEYSGLLD